jgi:ParB family chromosome partitioning protein
MSRKQVDYLAGLLSDEGDEAPSPARSRRSPLLERESALARVASGEVRQVTELRIDPARCRIWAGNGRAYEQLNAARCQDLIDSLIAEGGQKVPAIVRRVKDDPAVDFEVLAGTRRHWSVSWLRAHSYPDMVFVVQVVEIDDEAAFRLADLENRARADISDLERARNYRWALDAHYGGVQARMAERLKLSKGWLSKLLTMALLPDPVVAAFADPASITIRGGYELAAKCADENMKALVLREASRITTEQHQRAEDGNPPIEPGVVVRRLLTADVTRVGPRGESVLVLAANGKAAMTLQGRRGKVITLRVDLGAGVDRAALIEGLCTAIQDQSS